MICDPNADGNYLSPAAPWTTGEKRLVATRGPRSRHEEILALPFTANAAGTGGILSIGNNTSGFVDGIR